MLEWRELGEDIKELYLLIEKLKEGTSLIPEEIQALGLFLPNRKKETNIEPLIKCIEKYIKRSDLLRMEIQAGPSNGYYENVDNEFKVVPLVEGLYSKNFAVFTKKYITPFGLVRPFGLVTPGLDLYFYDDKEKKKFRIAESFGTLSYEAINIFKRTDDEIPNGVKANHVIVIANPSVLTLGSNVRGYIGESSEGFLIEIPPSYIIMRSPQDEIYCVKIFHHYGDRKDVAYVRPGNVRIEGSEILGIIQPREEKLNEMGVSITASEEYIESSKKFEKYILFYRS